MDKEDTIFMIIAAVVLVAILIWNHEPVGPAQSLDVDQPGDQNYPRSQWLTYNQPYQFAPPVANVLPQTATGLLGQTFPETGKGFTEDESGCGCGG